MSNTFSFTPKGASFYTIQEINAIFADMFAVIEQKQELLGDRLADINTVNCTVVNVPYAVDIGDAARVT